MPDWAVALIVAGSVIVLVAVIFLIWWFSSIHSMQRMGLKVEEAESNIDLVLAKRHELLAKEIAIIKGFAKQDSESLEKIASIHQPERNASLMDKAKFALQVTKAFDSINLFIKKYPDLKNVASFINLQDQVVDIEEQLQSNRRVYNGNVSTFNQHISVFPQSIVAKHYGMIKRDFFEVETAKHTNK